jgi:hypothetical protein
MRNAGVNYVRNWVHLRTDAVNCLVPSQTAFVTNTEELFQSHDEKAA